MMHFARLMGILTQPFYCLYSFVTNIASIKASTGFILFLSVFLVLPISATHIKSDTKKQIQNTESENDIKYSMQSTTYIDNPILKEKEDINIFLLIATIFCTIFITAFVILICSIWYFDFALINVDDVFIDFDIHQPNPNEDIRYIHMNGPIQGRRIVRQR